MKKLYTLSLLLLPVLFCCCEQPEPQKTFTGDSQFRTTEPSRLRFLNVRAVYYYRERPQHTKFDIYRLRKFKITKEKPLFMPVIVHNWLEDEAYLFFENNLYPHFADTLTVRWTAQTDSTTASGTHVLSLKNKKNQYEFGGAVFESLKNGHALEMRNRKGAFVPIYTDPDDRAAYLTTVRDYYRLTEVY